MGFFQRITDAIKSNHFDYIISTYAMHHLTDEEKISFIKLLNNVLAEKGKILIGDISFETREELEKSKTTYKESWDNDEIYFVADEMKESLSDAYSCMYIQLSHCSSVLTVENK